MMSKPSVEVGMTPLAFEEKLQEEHRWWAGVAAHLREQDYVDEQSLGQLRVAEEKLTVVENALRRLERGIFGRCEICGAEIEEERLESLLTCDCTRCAGCAAKLSLRIQRGCSSHRSRTLKRSVSVMPQGLTHAVA
jgi:RNA polymerase-binding transcription factor DksA